MEMIARFFSTSPDASGSDSCRTSEEEEAEALDATGCGTPSAPSPPCAAHPAPSEDPMYIQKMCGRYGAEFRWRSPSRSRGDSAEPDEDAPAWVVVDDYSAADLPQPSSGVGEPSAAASSCEPLSTVQSSGELGPDVGCREDDWSLIRLPPSREDCAAAADAACAADGGVALGPPLSAKEWRGWFTEDGALPSAAVSELERRIFFSGLSMEARAEAWCFLLDLRRYDEPESAWKSRSDALLSEYLQYKAQWSSFTPAQLRRFKAFREAQDVIDKDVRRTDRSLPEFEEDDSPMLGMLRNGLMTHAVYNVDLGYTQGMNDRLALLLLLLRDEAIAFWCFEGLLTKLQNYYEPGSSEIIQLRTQLSNLLRVVDPELSNYFEDVDNSLMLSSFAYSRFLLHFKRDFDAAGAMRVWEAIWTCPLTSFFHVFIAAAMLVRVRAEIIGKEMTSVMHLFQRQFDPGNVEELLQRATWLFHYYQALKQCDFSGSQSCPASVM
jgi:hypothetical protein